jgi:hypothetical protein
MEVMFHNFDVLILLNRHRDYLILYNRLWQTAAKRQKLSRAAQSVNRECGTETVFGVGSGELLANKLNRMKRLILAFGPDHPFAIRCIHCNDLKSPVAHPFDIQRGIVHATEPYVINLICMFFDSCYSQVLEIRWSVSVRKFRRSIFSKDCLCPLYPGLNIFVRQRIHVLFSVIHLFLRGANVKVSSKENDDHQHNNGAQENIRYPAFVQA